MIQRAEFRQDASALNNPASLATTVHVSVSNALHVPTRSQRRTALASVESLQIANNGSPRNAAASGMCGTNARRQQLTIGIYWLQTKPCQASATAA